ncbi:MAG TPA: hypothetical protein VGM57_06780 [Pseudolabrys sp.]|jgi:hypothetical protein
MSRPNPQNKFDNSRWRTLLALPAAFALTLAIPLLVMIAVLPLPVVLPAFSIWSLAAAAVAVLFALTRHAPRPRATVNAWDLAGAFTLIGCAAGILGEVEHMVDYVFSLSSRSQTNE